MANDFCNLGVFLASFGLAAFAGLAALLRSGSQLTWGGVLSAVLNSGLLGLGIALLWYNAYRDNLYFLVGVCLLSGLGGMTSLDFILGVVRRFVTGFAGKGKDNE